MHDELLQDLKRQMLSNMKTGQRYQALIRLTLQKLQTIHFLHIQSGLPGARQHAIIEIDADVRNAIFIQDLQPFATSATNIRNHAIRINVLQTCKKR